MQPLAAQSAPDLFLEPGKLDAPARVAMQAENNDLPPQFRLIRSRVVRLNLNIISPDNPDRPRTLQLNFFEDSSFEAVEFIARERGPGEGFEWFGAIDDGEPAQAVFSVIDGRVNGSLSTPQAHFQIRHIEGNLHAIQEVLVETPPSDDALTPNLPAVQSPDDSASAGGQPTVDENGNTVLDILVCYTTLTRQSRGGSRAVQDRIQLAVSEVNASFINSQIPISYNLVGMVEIDGDGGNGVPERPTAAYIAEITLERSDIHALRDYYGADLVSVWVNSPNGGAVGIGWVFQGGDGFSEFPYGIVAYQFALGPGYTFAHEAGHNMGAAHDRANAGAAGRYDYSYGFRQGSVDPKFYTIMAYSSGCSGCQSVNHWSNPEVEIERNGVFGPSGVPDGESDSADNALTIANTALIQSAYRATANPPVNSLPQPSGQAVEVDKGASVVINLFAVDPDSDPLRYSIATQPLNGVLTGSETSWVYTPDPEFVGPDAFIFHVHDNRGGFATATVSIDVVAAGGPSVNPPPAEGLTITAVTNQWQTVGLSNAYASPVVVCTPQYGAGAAPATTRVRNVSSTSFELQLARLDGSANPLPPATVRCFAIEEGVFTTAEHGVKLEAVKMISTVTDRFGSWSGQSRAYVNNYARPIVVGQVMTANDPSPSTFWSRGAIASYPPTSSTLFVGKNVGEDPNPARADETIGYIVLEAGAGSVGPLAIEAGLSPRIYGYGSAPPYPIPITGDPSGAVLSGATMAGDQGGWPVLYGSQAVGPQQLNAAWDEDQLADAERLHVGEFLAFLAWTDAPSANRPPTANPQSLSVESQTAASITLSGSDPDLDPLLYAIETPPANGVLSGTAPNLSYTPNGGYVGPDSFVFSVDDSRGGFATAVVSITVGAPPASASPLAEGMTLPAVTDQWRTVTLRNPYVSPVVVCTPQYGPGYAPAAVRLRNVGPTSFELQLARQDGSSAALPPTAVSCFAIEEGVYNEADHGIKLEAVKMTSTVTDRFGSWRGERRTYANSYQSPVVLGQVMSANDAAASTFWARGFIVSYAPDSNWLFVGKNVGEDPNPSRQDETIGYIVVEAGVGSVGPLTIETGLSPQVFGVGNAPPYSIPIHSVPSGAVVSGATMAGDQGGWPVLFGANPVGPQLLQAAWDEDALKDSERSHAGELLGFLAWTDASGGNRAPTANPQSLTVAYQTATPITLSGSDPDFDSLTYGIESIPAHGVLSGTAPNLTYTPNAGYAGPDAFTFSVDDNQGGLATATVSITVGGANQAPVADSQTVATPFETATAITLSGSDPDLDSLQFAIEAPPANGVLSGAAPNVTYTPNAGYSGSDAFTFSVDDSRGGFATATVSITVGTPPTTGSPTAEGITIAVVSSEWQTVGLTNEYSSPVVVCTPQYGPGAAPATVRLRHVGPTSFELQLARFDGSTDPLPAASARCFVIEEGVYNVAEHGIKLEAAKMTSTVTDRFGSWVGERRSYSNSYESPVVLGQVMTANDVSPSAFWSRGIVVTLAPSSTHLFVGKNVGEDPNTARADETIGYIVLEAGGGSIGALIVEAGLSPRVQGFEGAPPYSIPLSGDPNGAVLSGATMAGDQGGWPMLYGPDAVRPQLLQAAWDEDQIVDAERTHTGELLGYLAWTNTLADNKPPTANPQSVSVAFETASPILLSALDPDLDPLAYSIVTPPSNGVLTGQAPNLIYTPNSEYSGPDSFTFSAEDGDGGLSESIVSITVEEEVNHLPTAESQSVNVTYQTARPITLIGWDPDEDPLAYTIESAPSNGLLSGVAPDVVYTPNAGYSGPDAFTFSVDDGRGGSAQALVSISVGSASSTVFPPRAEGLNLSAVTHQWQTVPLTNTYVSPVVVCTPEYGPGSPPLTSQLRNVGPTSFELRLNRFDGSSAGLAPNPAKCFVIEEGVYNVAEHGINLEALHFTSVGTDGITSWSDRPFTYVNSYSSPIVLGQVMTANDPDPSVFWSRGLDPTVPPSSARLVMGKNIGEDTDTNRLNETIGYIILEAGLHSIGSVTLETGLIGAVGGYDDNPPYVQDLFNEPTGAVLSGATMIGANGGWPVLYGPNAVGSQQLRAVWDEDQIADVERGHLEEQVAYLAWFDTNVSNQPPTADAITAETSFGSTAAVTLSGSDPEGGPLTYGVVDGPRFGDLSGTAPNLVYTPYQRFAGNDSFTFYVRDAEGGVTLGEATIAVNKAVNVEQIVISTAAELQTALRDASPGEEYLLAPGTYGRAPGEWFTTLDYGLLGRADHPIIFRAQDPSNPPTITALILLMSAQYVEFHDIRFVISTGNVHGLNIFPKLDIPVTDIVFENCFFRMPAEAAEMAAIKATRLDNLTVRNTEFRGWGDNAVDTVGVWGGMIEDNVFIGLPNHRQRTALQMKGESRDIIVRNNYFENAGDRVIQAGGSTGSQFFRRHPQFEAVNIEIYGNRIVGGDACFSFSTQNGSRFHHNTCYLPDRWIGRLLHENEALELNQNGRIENNIFVYTGDLGNEFVNLSYHGLFETFVFDGNAFYQVDGDREDFPLLPTPDVNMVDQIDPELLEPGTARMRVGSSNPRFEGIGADAVNPVP